MALLQQQREKGHKLRHYSKALVETLGRWIRAKSGISATSLRWIWWHSTFQLVSGNYYAVTVSAAVFTCQSRKHLVRRRGGKEPMEVVIRLRSAIFPPLHNHWNYNQLISLAEGSRKVSFFLEFSSPSWKKMTSSRKRKPNSIMWASIMGEWSLLLCKICIFIP